MAETPQRACRKREQAAQQKQLGVMRSSRDFANTWSPELKMKSGADILDLLFLVSTTQAIAIDLLNGHRRRLQEMNSVTLPYFLKSKANMLF